MMRYKTCRFSRTEIQQAANIQIQEISQGFLSSFGEKALGLIFTNVAESNWGIMVLALDETQDQVLGYVFGTMSAGKLYKDFLLRRTAAALFYFLPRMLSLQRIKKAIETLLYPVKNRLGNLPEAELLDLAVIATYHGTEVAKELFRNFVDECRSHGIEAFKIPTSESLKRAHRFYEKMGARRVGSVEVHKGQETILYIYTIQKRHQNHGSPTN